MATPVPIHCGHAAFRWTHAVDMRVCQDTLKRLDPLPLDIHLQYSHWGPRASSRMLSCDVGTAAAAGSGRLVEIGCTDWPEAVMAS